MKRLAYSLLLFLALPAASGFAQGKFMYGFTGGLTYFRLYNISSSSSSSSFLTPYSSGMLGGVEIGYFNWNSLSYYLQFSFVDYSSSTHFELPIMAIVPVIHPDWRIYIYGGPILAYGIPSDVGLSGGLGFSYPISPGADFFLQCGYYYGLKNQTIPVEYSPAIGPLVTFSTYQREFRFSIGILMGK
jgi:hypothetical protein